MPPPVGPNFDSTIPAPPVTVPFVELKKVGENLSYIIAPVWYRFLLTLWLRSGGNNPTPVPDVEALATLAVATEDDPQLHAGLTQLALAVPTSQEPPPDLIDFTLASASSQECCKVDLAPMLAVATEQEPALDPLVVALAIATEQEPLFYTGTWTPTDASGAALVFTNVSANYTKIGPLVFAYATLTFPATADGSNVLLGGFPLAAANQGYAQPPFLVRNSGAAIGTYGSVLLNTTTAEIYNDVTNARVTNANLSTLLLRFIAIYPIA